MIAQKKGVLKQPIAAKRVRIKAGDANADCQGKINIQKSLRVTVPQSPKFPQSPTVAVTFGAWSVTTDKADALYQDIMNTESILEQMYGTLGTTMLQYSIDRDAFLVAAEDVCDNADDAKAFGLTTMAAPKRLNAASAPGDLRFSFGDAGGDLTGRWTHVPGAGAYIAQQSVDPPTDASWEQCYIGTSPLFRLTGLTLGQKLCFRVMSVGKTPSPWSAPVLVTVR